MFSRPLPVSTASRSKPANRGAGAWPAPYVTCARGKGLARVTPLTVGGTDAASCSWCSEPPARLSSACGGGSRDEPYNKECVASRFDPGQCGPKKSVLAPGGGPEGAALAGRPRRERNWRGPGRCATWGCCHHRDRLSDCVRPPRAGRVALLSLAVMAAILRVDHDYHSHMDRLHSSRLLSAKRDTDQDAARRWWYAPQAPVGVYGSVLKFEYSFAKHRPA